MSDTLFDLNAQIVIPGDLLPDHIQDNDSELVLGPGISTDTSSNTLIPVNPGYLRVQQKSKKKKIIFVDSPSKNYTPNLNDLVIGVVLGTIGESYKVSLSNFKPYCLLSFYSIENASRKNRLNFKVGDLVYARVSKANVHIDVELECLNEVTNKSDGFGLLDNGYVFDTSLNYARHLFFNSDNSILTNLSNRCRFDIAIGINGKIWIKTDDLITTLAASIYIQKAQTVPEEQLNSLLFKTFKNYDL
ncbi:exosome non-catalytic core subunit RRP40 [Ascoidea rubescens DSM 1968]|uniref:Exosome complex exonuclease RRP40 n=1 Tax=Ascoidea rubescens DSM 1968 TaxID=1344418 RepID=A0A1D2VLX6_9ASCO|nr:exosome complex exonuclease RRP40 [Ascoidea rubescens DSM 1968]ODV62555.1 exosome complex exonuclease RRP40 [Ascoidea rubescens DSM 1968]